MLTVMTRSARPTEKLPAGGQGHGTRSPAVLRLDQARAGRRRDASCSASTGTPAPASTRSSPAPGSPRARSTTTSAASRRSSRRSSSRSRPTPPGRSTAALKGATRPVGEGAGRAARVPRGGPGAAYQRIVIQDGPAILGYERFREQEERSTFGIVQDIVALGARGVDLRARRGDDETFSRIFFGAMSAAGESVSTAEDPEQAVGPGRGRDRLHPRPASARSPSRASALPDPGVHAGRPEPTGPQPWKLQMAARRRCAAPARSRCARPGTFSVPAVVAEHQTGAGRDSFVQVPRTTLPSWKSSALPLPVKIVSGTGLPAGSR